MISVMERVFKMCFEIFFDESNKIDKMTSKYAYYGVVGWMKSEREKFETFRKEKLITKELHFSQFRLNDMYTYLTCIEYALEKIESNFYLVNVPEVLEMGKHNGLEESLLRKLLYMKIPERLIYGLTREHQKQDIIKIFLDKSEEYGSDTSKNICTPELLESIVKIFEKNNKDISKLKIGQLINDTTNNHIQLPRTLMEQLNAQAIYRGLDYKVEDVCQIDSKDSISLQITDSLLGILAFIIEEKYLDLASELTLEQMKQIQQNVLIDKQEKSVLTACYKYKNGSYKLESSSATLANRDILRQINKKVNMTSKVNIGKSEFIYRLLNKEENLDKLFKINLFRWGDIYNTRKQGLNNKEPERIYLSEYISQFFRYKVNFDNSNKQKIVDYFYKKDIKDKKKIQKVLGYSGSLNTMFYRYWDELELEQ